MGSDNVPFIKYFSPKALKGFIKKEMNYHFDWSAEPLADAKIKFYRAIQDVVKGIQPEEIAVAGFSPKMPMYLLGCWILVLLNC